MFLLIFIKILSRKTVESQLYIMKNDFTRKNIPFLLTSELFKLKWAIPTEDLLGYLQEDIDVKRFYLNNNVYNTPLSMIGKNGTRGDVPAYIKDVEWFSSTKAVCEGLEVLKDKTEKKEDFSEWSESENLSVEQYRSQMKKTVGAWNKIVFACKEFHDQHPDEAENFAKLETYLFLPMAHLFYVQRHQVAILKNEQNGPVIPFRRVPRHGLRRSHKIKRPKQMYCDGGLVPVRDRLYDVQHLQVCESQIYNYTVPHVDDHGKMYTFQFYSSYGYFTKILWTPSCSRHCLRYLLSAWWQFAMHKTR